MRHQVLGDALKEKMAADVLQGKGGFWVKNKGFYTLAEARRLTGIAAPSRKARPKVALYGDWAWVARINGIKG